MSDKNLTPEAKEQIRKYFMKMLAPTALIVAVLSGVGGYLIKGTINVSVKEGAQKEVETIMRYENQAKSVGRSIDSVYRASLQTSKGLGDLAAQNIDNESIAGFIFKSTDLKLQIDNTIKDLYGKNDRTDTLSSQLDSLKNQFDEWLEEFDDLGVLVMSIADITELLTQWRSFEANDTKEFRTVCKYRFVIESGVNEGVYYFSGIHKTRINGWAGSGDYVYVNSNEKDKIYFRRGPKTFSFTGKLSFLTCS